MRAKSTRAQIIDGHTRKAYAHFVKRKFHVTMIEHDEGVSVSRPELPGCHSQGANVDEAMANISDAIQGYIESLNKHGEPIPEPVNASVVEVSV
jgi:predicted RNase H-like HicB family nuclease